MIYTQIMEAQINFCNMNKLPMFATNNCSSCGENIWRYITLEVASKQLITGCPHCNYSFCE
jgi:hypothetical protein